MDQGVSTSKNDGGGESGSDSPSKDKLFDPSIDMLVNDFDDERTLEEEEALAAGEADDPSAELSNLEKEGNMPLEELLALYGYNTAEDKESSSDSEDEEELHQEEEQICEPIVEKERSPTPPRHSKLSILYEPMLDDVDDTRNLRSVSRISEDEEDYASGAEEDDYRKLRKTIMVGGDYQAQIPEGLHYYDNTPPYENDDELLWTPQEKYSQKIEEYLKKAHEISKPSIPKGSSLRDDEEALYLLQQCGYNTEEALKRLEARPQLPPSPAANNINELIWSEEECRNFEAGVRTYGKDFHLIQQNKVKTRSVCELVQFYYLWKKTERHDVFANKVSLEKKKYSLHPGLTDFMDRFLEGIGKGIVMALAEKGAQVVVFDVNEENLELLRQMLPQIETRTVDLRDWNRTQEAVKSVLPIDLLVNNAGIGTTGPFAEITEENFDNLFGINIKSYFNVTRVVVDNLIQNELGGSIVNVSSIATSVPLPNSTLYTSSKHAVDGFTQALAMELGSKKIRVNSVNPGLVKTNLSPVIWENQEMFHSIMRRTPLQRVVNVEDVVEAVLFLLSDKSEMITGTCLKVDGGHAVSF